MQKLKNFLQNLLKVIAIIVGFILFIAIVAGLLVYLAYYDLRIFGTILAVAAGLCMFYAIKSKSKERNKIKTSPMGWIMASLIGGAYAIVLPIWFFNITKLWLVFLFVGMIAVAISIMLLWIVEGFVVYLIDYIQRR